MLEKNTAAKIHANNKKIMFTNKFDLISVIRFVENKRK